MEKESDDCWTCFFTVPKEDGDVNTYEASLCTTWGKMGLYASDNRLSEESDQLVDALGQSTLTEGPNHHEQHHRSLKKRATDPPPFKAYTLTQSSWMLNLDQPTSGI